MTETYKTLLRVYNLTAIGFGRVRIPELAATEALAMDRYFRADIPQVDAGAARLARAKDAKDWYEVLVKVSIDGSPDLGHRAACLSALAKSNAVIREFAGQQVPVGPLYHGIRLALTAKGRKRLQDATDPEVVQRTLREVANSQVGSENSDRNLLVTSTAIFKALLRDGCIAAGLYEYGVYRGPLKELLLTIAKKPSTLDTSQKPTISLANMDFEMYDPQVAVELIYNDSLLA
jgi:hypothetical protein